MHCGLSLFLSLNALSSQFDPKPSGGRDHAPFHERPAVTEIDTCSATAACGTRSLKVLEMGPVISRLKTGNEGALYVLLADKRAAAGGTNYRLNRPERSKSFRLVEQRPDSFGPLVIANLPQVSGKGQRI